MARKRTAEAANRRGLAMLLGPSLVWLGVIYLGSLAVLLATAFWHYDSFTFSVDPAFTFENFREVVTGDIYRTVTARTILMATSVTIADALLALPLAFYIAKLAGNRMKAVLLVLVLMPLWSSYLVKSYAWRLILSDGGVLAWALSPLGLGSPGFGNVAVFIGLAYLWLPFMILPLVAGFERIPGTMLEASSDLGARAGKTLRYVVFPLLVPALAAGSIFTFSLTMGDYIAVELLGSNQFIGSLIYSFQGVSGNVPLAAALAYIPLLVMILYLVAAKRVGAFDAL